MTIIRAITIVLFCLILSSTFAENNPSYQIFIVQDNIRKEVQWNEDVLNLRKAPFLFEVHLYNIPGVYISIASSPTYYQTPLKKNFVEPENIGPMCQAEEPYNLDKDILLDNETFCYWYYEKNDTLYRFDKNVKTEGSHITATMSVEKIVVNEKEHSMAEFDFPLFLVFFNTIDKDGISKKIIDRKKIKLVFE